MTTNLFVYACLAIGLTTALVGGVFQAFSDFVIAGLVRAAPAGGIDSMQQCSARHSWPSPWRWRPSCSLPPFMPGKTWKGHQSS